MRKAMLAPLLAGVVFAVPATAGASVVKGVVLSSSPSHHELVVAARNGTTATLHVSIQVVPGTLVSTSTRALGDGTFAAGRVHILGHSARAEFKGVLLKKVGSSVFFSAGKSIVVVRTATRGLASARSTSPLQPGESADVGLTITPQRTLTADSITPIGQTNTITLQVTVSAHARNRNDGRVADASGERPDADDPASGGDAAACQRGHERDSRPDDRLPSGLRCRR